MLQRIREDAWHTELASDGGRLVDVIAVDLVPVLLGEGIPFFAGLGKAPVELDTPTVVEAKGVTHLSYPVRRFQ